MCTATYRAREIEWYVKLPQLPWLRQVAIRVQMYYTYANSNKKHATTRQCLNNMFLKPFDTTKITIYIFGW